MRQMRRCALILALVVCFLPILGLSVGAAGNVPGLADVINGNQTTASGSSASTESETASQSTSTTAVQSETVSPDPAGAAENTTDGVLPNTGIDIQGAFLGEYNENTEVVAQFQTALGQAMGTILPILVGIISACMVIVMLLDLLYIVAPFTRDKLAPGVSGDSMSEMQGGAQGNMYGNNMNMQGNYSPYGTRGRGSGAYNNQNGQQGAQAQGRQWVSQAAINAVMGGQQPGPDGKQRSQYALYFKSMFIPLLLVPVMLVLLLSGVLTDVGFYIGNLISNGIQNRVS